MKKIVISIILLVALMTAVTAVPSSMGLSKGQPFLYPQGSCPIGSSIRAINPDGTIVCEIDDVGDPTADTIADDGVIQGSEVDSSQVQLRVSGLCAAGSSIRTIFADGTVTCEADDVGDATPDTNADDGVIQGSEVDSSQVQLRVSGICAVGSSIVAINPDGTVTCQSGITGTGSNGQVTFWTGASTISGNNNLFWDNSDSQLGIGTNTPINGLRTHQLGSMFIDASNNAHGTNANVALTVDGVGGNDIAKFRDVGANPVFDINSNSIELYSNPISGVSVIMFAAKTPGDVAGGACGTSCNAVSANAACLSAWTSVGALTSCGAVLSNSTCLCANSG